MSRAWSERELDALRHAYDQAGGGPFFLDTVAASIGRSRAAVAVKANRLGLTNQHRQKQPDHAAALNAARTGPPDPENPWTNEDLHTLRSWYAAREGTAVNRRALARKLGRTESAVSHMAVRLGLTGPRPTRWNDEVPHPRGALGLQHTPATKARISKASRDRMEAKTPDEQRAGARTLIEITRAL